MQKECLAVAHGEDGVLGAGENEKEGNLEIESQVDVSSFQGSG